MTGCCLWGCKICLLNVILIEPTFSSTSIVGIETHLSQAFLRDVFDLMEHLISAEASGATLGADMGCYFWGHFWLLYLGLFSLGSDTLEIKKENFNFWSTNSFKEGPCVLLTDSLSSPFYSKWIPLQLNCSRIIFCIYIWVPSVTISA